MSIFRPLLLCMLLFLVLPATGQRIAPGSLVIDRIIQSGNIKSVRETRHEWDTLAYVRPDEYSFNPQTLTITLMRYYTTGYRRKHEYVYDSALHLTESNVYWSGCEDSTNFKVVHRYRYEYAEGKAISREFIRGDTARESARYEYNREGQLVKTSIFDHQYDSIPRVTAYEYTVNGDSVVCTTKKHRYSTREVTISEKGRVKKILADYSMAYEYVYDEAGQLIEHITINHSTINDGKEVRPYCIRDTLKYDSRGNLVEFRRNGQYPHGRTKERITYIYEYFEP